MTRVTNHSAFRAIKFAYEMVRYTLTKKIRYLTHAYEKNKIPDVFSAYEKIKRYGT